MKVLVTRKQSKQYFAEYRAKNRLKVRAQQRSWYLLNKDRADAAAKKYRDSGRSEKARQVLISKNPKKHSELAVARAKKCRNKNPDRYRLNQRIHQAKRRALGGHIEDKKEVLSVYINCPKDQEVDHILPLNNDRICGLHVSWNLQYLSRADNAVKNNNFDGTYENKGWKS